ncbi:MAG TPA: exodeoxyribonuclease VII small subunit [Candidatus Paceibacterota bacterium]|nr:exodeoxyribonuclease VII small subunit [Candidatus Paceibacterota bacterium]
MPKKTDTIAASLEKLEGIVTWLDGQTQVDVEEGLRKVREGAELVKSLRTRLKTVANKFEEVDHDLGDENP